MNVLGICGSPRDGNTLWIMQEIFDMPPSREIKSELIPLNGLNIELCDGCLICEDKKKCHRLDDIQKIYKKLASCDKLVIGTPVYFDSVPALLKNFIDRLNPLCVSESLKNKDFYLIVIGQLKEKEGMDSRKKVINYFKALCDIFGMNFCKAWGLSAREPQEVSKVYDVSALCKEIRDRIYGSK